MNLNTLLFLAQAGPEIADPETLRKSLKSTGGSGNTEIIIILGCALALSVLLFIWAFFVRKRPKSARGSVVVERRRKGSSAEEDTKRRKRRRLPEHPDNWGRNPTLGETGGLPPERTVESGADKDDDANHDGPHGGSQAARPR